MGPFNHLVDSDDPVVAGLLASTIEIVLEAGGWMHPKARVVVRSGQLSVACDGDSSTPLFQIPESLWVRVDQVTWGDDAGRLIVEGFPDDFGDLEIEMLYTQVALHNQCGRLQWIAATHPSVATDLSDDIIMAVRSIVPSFRSEAMTTRDVLFSNRCFRMQLDDGLPPQRILIPLVDLLNHHSAGATGSVTDDAFVVSVEQPFGTAECALDYGMQRDAMQLAVVYGFADSSSTIAHSAPGLTEADTAANLALLHAVINACDSAPASTAASILRQAAVQQVAAVRAYAGG